MTLPSSQGNVTANYTMRKTKRTINMNSTERRKRKVWTCLLPDNRSQQEELTRVYRCQQVASRRKSCDPHTRVQLEDRRKGGMGGVQKSRRRRRQVDVRKKQRAGPFVNRAPHAHTHARARS